MGKIRTTIDNIDKFGADKVEESPEIVKRKEVERIGVEPEALTGTNVLKGATPVLPTEELGFTEPVEQQSDEEGLGVSGREKLIQTALSSPQQKFEDKTKLAVQGPVLKRPGDTGPVDDNKTRATLAEEERAGQLEGTPAPFLDDDFYNFTDAKTLIAKFKNKRKVRKQTVNAVVNTGIQIESILPNLENEIAQSNSPDVLKLKNYLINKGILNRPDNTGASLKFDRRLSNALAFEVLGIIQDHVNREMISYSKGKESGLINESDVTAFLAGTDLDAPVMGTLQGEKLDPKYIRGRIGVNLLNHLIDNPNKVGKYYTDYGGEGDSLLRTDPKVSAMFDTMMYSVVNDLGFFDAVTDDETGETFYAVNEEAAAYFDNARDILWATGARTKEDVSLIPTRITEGEKIPFSFTPKDKGPVTIKSKMALTQKIQRKAKAHLGGVEYSIQKRAAKIAKSVAELLIVEPKIINEKPVVQALNHPPSKVVTEEQKQQIRESAAIQAQGNVALRGKSDQEIQSYIDTTANIAIEQAGIDRSKFYSTHPFAEMFSLGEKKYLEHYDHAIKNSGATEQSAKEQANTQMKVKAREVYETLMDSDRLKDKVFYMKLFNALANNRVHYRNSVMNPQNDKLARAIMGNARRVVIDFNKELSPKQKRVMQGWKAIIGKNLLPVEMTGGVPSENLTVGAIIDATERVLNRGSQVARDTYDNWLRIGRELKAMSNPKRVNILALDNLIKVNADDVNNLIGLKALKDLRDRENWNYVFQSYIDFANWHDASNKTIEPKLSLESDTLSLTVAQENQLADLQDSIREAKQAGDEATVADIETQIMSILEGVNLLADPSPKVSTFSPRAQAQFDGKQNGIAIQAMQNGDVDLMKQTGLIFASEDNVIPQGDIRKTFADHTGDVIEGQVFKGGSEIIENKKSFWLEVFDEYKGSNDAVKIFKELSKQPLMETSYGKYHMFHRETAENFYNGNFGDVIKDVYKRYSNMIPNYDSNQIIDDLNEIISATLTQTLDLKHQRVLKDYGKLFSMFGVVPYFQGPLGETLFMGSREYVESNKAVDVPTSRGIVRRNIGRMKPSGANRSKKQRIFDNQTNEWRTADPTPFGQEVSNQIVVLGIQNIDSGILMTAVNRVNDPRKPEEGSAYVIPVHDAVIVDATSVLDYVPAMNNSFTDVNLQYSLPQALNDSLLETKARFSQKIKDNEIYELSLQSKYKAVQDYLNQIFKRAQEKREVAQKVSPRDVVLMNRAVENGYKPEGSKIEGRKLIRLIFSINDHMNLSLMFSEWITNSKAFKQKAAQELFRKPITLPDGTRVLRLITNNYG